MLEGTLVALVSDSIEFRFTVSNADDEPIALIFRDALKADFAVFEGDTEVWRWSTDRMFAQAIEEATLQPGETATFDAQWTDPTPGEYTARAEIRAADAECEATTRLTIQ